MIVLDASAVVELLLQSPAGVAIAEELLTSEVALHAPHLLDAQVAHALREAWLRGALDKARVRDALVDLADLPIERHEHLPLLERVWGLREALIAYDVLYAALAEALAAPLLTCDVRIAGASGAAIEVLVR